MKTHRVDERAEMATLDEHECLVLLRWEVVGRLAVAAPDEAPTVVPINFVVDDSSVVFRTEPSHTVDLVLAHPVSVQVDRFDWYRRIGWSVLLKGKAEEVSMDTAVELGVEPWAPGSKTLAIRITPHEITGRRLSLAQQLVEGRGYR